MQHGDLQLALPAYSRRGRKVSESVTHIYNSAYFSMLRKITGKQSRVL